jgi:aryl-alcohol dehydrogenase-like predicted oxidoreductase
MFGSAMTAALAQQALAQQPSSAGLPTRKLGRTNEQVSILCLGGWHIGAVEDKAEAVRIMHAAVDEGMTFFDNCWDYHNGGAEEIMGRALAQEGYRKKVFLMTKN